MREVRLRSPRTGFLRRNTAAAIYGTIVTAALIAGDSRSTTNMTDIAVSVAVVVPLYWLAHAYAEFIAQGIHEHIRPRLVATLRQELPTVQAAVPLVGIMLVLGTVGVGENAAVYAALWLAVAELLAFAFVAARHNRLRGLALLGAAGTSALFGVAIVVLKAVLH